MKPDEQTQAVLDGMAEGGGPALHELPLEEARAALLVIKDTMDMQPVPLPDVRDVSMPVDGCEIPLRIYSPLSDAQALPTVVFFHGGGWALGDLDTHDNFCRYIASEVGAVVVAVHYRRPPEHKFPIAHEDCYSALCWASENASDFGGDPGRIAVCGDSAGGNLAAAVCQMAKKRGRPKIRYQALIYPETTADVNCGYASRKTYGSGEYFLSQKDLVWLNGMYFDDEAKEVCDVRASPILEPDLSGLPPALVVTAGCDPLADEGSDYAEKLRKAGVPTEFRCFETTVHGFIAFSSVIDVGKEGLALISASLRDGLS